MKYCSNCKIELTSHQNKYCSNVCQGEFQWAVYIQKWKQGKVDGGRGIHTRNISRHIRRYLILKYGEHCSQCGWHKRHPASGSVPLEVDHVDGDSENNLESNLRLLCPNCHALTSTFKNHNQGKGRTWRTLKYVKNAQS